jgi:hypothetical protein
MAYQESDQQEKLIEHLLHILSSIGQETAPAALIATASRFMDRLVDCHVE